VASSNAGSLGIEHVKGSLGNNSSGLFVIAILFRGIGLRFMKQSVASL
jgi:hypothetical protein